MTEFEDLFRRYARDVYRFALALTRDRAQAEDITSETFVRAWTAPGEIRMATVKGYLFMIARNLYLQSLRRSRRHVELDDRIPDPGRDLEADAEARSDLHHALAALDELKDMDRAALLMRARDDMSYDEIARVLGLTVTATKVRIHRARRFLLARRTTR